MNPAKNLVTRKKVSDLFLHCNEASHELIRHHFLTNFGLFSLILVLSTSCIRSGFVSYDNNTGPFDVPQTADIGQRQDSGIQDSRNNDEDVRTTRDAGVEDRARPDTSFFDTRLSDAHVFDADISDSGTAETSQVDREAFDTTQQDVLNNDANQTDGALPDAGSSDSAWPIIHAQSLKDISV